MNRLSRGEITAAESGEHVFSKCLLEDLKAVRMSRLENEAEPILLLRLARYAATPQDRGWKRGSLVQHSLVQHALRWPGTQPGAFHVFGVSRAKGIY
jgi:hypothetical protein